ncbi:hypothetical protein [Erwinia sp. HR93]|uniref:hypothetical protein n=1 Tax=Erwinia sp. HR93 TaxID=3094840 RepID=UPI002ADEAB0A|nr:hypothetical protein [Erwinia sp. HR93]MEA1065337.1 hypothetical protein [Erwinia sp. HR93]
MTLSKLSAQAACIADRQRTPHNLWRRYSNTLMRAAAHLRADIYLIVRSTREGLSFWLLRRFIVSVMPKPAFNGHAFHYYAYALEARDERGHIAPGNNRLCQMGALL